MSWWVVETSLPLLSLIFLLLHRKRNLADHSSINSRLMNIKFCCAKHYSGKFAEFPGPTLGHSDLQALTLSLMQKVSPSVLNKFPKMDLLFLEQEINCKANQNYSFFFASPLECHKTRWVQAFMFKKKCKDDSGAHFTRDSCRLTIYVGELSYIITSERSLKVCIA